MSFCTKCGAKIEYGERFCTGCGASVETDEAAFPAASVPFPAVTQQPGVPAQDASQPIKVCNECGQELPQSATVCSLCSAPVTASAAQTAAPPPPPPQIAAPPQYNVPPQLAYIPQQQQFGAPQPPPAYVPPPQQQYAPPPPQQFGAPHTQQPQVQTMQQTYPYGAPQPMNYGQPAPSPNKKKIIIIAVTAVVALAAIGVILFFVLGGSPLVGTWEIVGEGLMITFNRNGTGEMIYEIGISESFRWGDEGNNTFWIDYGEYGRDIIEYEFRGGDLYIEGDRLVKIR